MPKKQTPEITIAEDKLVLAVAPIKVEGKFCYVYSLICPKENNSFIMEPKVEISMSTDPDVATMHYAATKKMFIYLPCLPVKQFSRKSEYIQEMTATTKNISIIKPEALNFLSSDIIVFFRLLFIPANKYTV